MADRSAIDELLTLARAGLDRVEPQQLADEVAAGGVLVDIRPVEQRSRDGELAGAVVVDRNVLEWRLDPTSPDRLPIAVDHAVALHHRLQRGVQLQPRRRHPPPAGPVLGDRSRRWIPSAGVG